MDSWAEEKEKRRLQSLARHARLAVSFRKDRLAFERERKEMIEAAIRLAADPAMRAKLRALQASWDKRMKGGGCAHNRFVLSKYFFWEHFNAVWHPAIRELNRRLNGPE